MRERDKDLLLLGVFRFNEGMTSGMTFDEKVTRVIFIIEENSENLTLGHNSSIY